MFYRLKHQLHRNLHPERYRLLTDLLHNQALSKIALAVKHSDALSNIIRYAHSNTRFYHEKYASYIDAKLLITSPSTLPLLSKDELVLHMDSMLSQAADKLSLSVGSTSGSTGKPVNFYYDQQKHELMRAGMIRSYMWSGWKPGQKILNFWGARQDIQHQSTLSRIFVEFISAEKTINAFEYSETQLAAWATFICSWKPVLLQGYASILAELAKFVIHNDIKMPNSIIGIYSTAEMLTDSQRQLMQQAFGCKVFNQYGCREIPNIACECTHGKLHIFSDMVALESLRIDNEDRLIITSLTNRVMPLIRYDIGDTGRILKDDCACGSPFPIMEMEFCRSNDLIKTQSGKKIHPSYFNRLLYGMTDIKQYQYVQKELDKITLNIVSTKAISSAIEKSLQQSIRRDIDESMVLEINHVEKIKRSASGKHRFVIRNL